MDDFDLGSIGIHIEATGPGLAVELVGYRSLAVAVLAMAVTDFGVVASVFFVGRPRARAKGVNLADEQLRHAIAAGEFLLERDDPGTRLWFQMAGVDLGAVRRLSKWHQRLSTLKRKRDEAYAQRAKRRPVQMRLVAS